MLDIKFIRENAELVQEGAKKKHILFDVAKLIEVDDKRKIISQNLEEKRARQNKVSIDVSKAGQSGNIEEKEKLIKEMQPLKEEMLKMEEELKEVMIAWQKLMVSVPNIPDMSVPEGDDDGTNIEVKKWGEIPKFNFTSKDHIELMENLDLADFETGAKVSGFRHTI